MVWVLLPLKDMARAKTRLSGMLAPRERRALSGAMVEDVLGALVGARGLAGIQLVSDDPGAEPLARGYGVEAVTERSLGCRGLNRVLAAAVAGLRRRGVEEVLVMHGDLPLVRAADVEGFLDDCRESGADVLIAPDLDRTGTNAMSFRVAARPEFRYGPGSCPAHRAGCRERRLNCRLHENPRLGLDVDSPGDLPRLYRELRADPRAAVRTAEVLSETGLFRRLAAMERTGFSSAAKAVHHDAV